MVAVLFPISFDILLARRMGTSMVGRRKKLGIWSHELLLHVFTVKTCGLACQTQRNLTRGRRMMQDDPNLCSHVLLKVP